MREPCCALITDLVECLRTMGAAITVTACVQHMHTCLASAGELNDA